MVKDIEIIHGKRSITADTALRLARHFGNSPQFWLGLQMDYDLDVETDRLSARIEKEVKRLNDRQRNTVCSTEFQIV